MTHDRTRRNLLGLVPGFLAFTLVHPRRALAQSDSAPPAGAAPGPQFPAQPPELVREVVGASHHSLERVRELVEARPALARAAWDWGYGDWESALGAASHTGQRAIAELLLAHGARPTLFSAAMLGQLAVVRAFVEAAPGAQAIPGPHGIPLLDHARAGGAPAAAVVAYLESVGGGGGAGPTLAPLDPADRDALLGRYAFGAGPTDDFTVDWKNELLGLTRAGGTRRLLFHLGDLAFHPSGAPAARITFTRAGGPATQVTVRDGEVAVTAQRVG